MIPKINLSKLDMKDIITGVLILVLVYLTFNNVLTERENFDTILDLEKLSSPTQFNTSQINALAQKMTSDLTTEKIEAIKARKNLCIKDKCLEEQDIIKIISQRTQSGGSTTSQSGGSTTSQSGGSTTSQSGGR